MDKEGYVTLEDAYVYFSWEEWELLAEMQRFLNRNVVLENFALMTMLGCWYNADNEETFFCMRSPESGVFIQKAHPCEMCGLRYCT